MSDGNCPAHAKACALDDDDPEATEGNLFEKLKHNANVTMFLLANGA